MTRGLVFLLILWCATAEAAAPTVDGSALNGVTSASSGTVTLTTSLTNDIIVVVVMAENTSGSPVSVSSVSGGSLSWAKRAAVSGTIAQAGGAGNCVGDHEVWWALSAAALSATVITVNVSSSVDAMSLVAFGVNGTKTSAPWDSNAGNPITQAYNSVATAIQENITTTEANDLIIGTYSECRNATHTAGTNYTAIQQQLTGGTNWDKVGVEQKGVTTTQSGLLVDWMTATASWFNVTDALTADSAPVNPISLPLVGVGR